MEQPEMLCSFYGYVDKKNNRFIEYLFERYFCNCIKKF